MLADSHSASEGRSHRPTWRRRPPRRGLTWQMQAHSGRPCARSSEREDSPSSSSPIGTSRAAPRQSPATDGVFHPSGQPELGSRVATVTDVELEPFATRHGPIRGEGIWLEIGVMPGGFIVECEALALDGRSPPRPHRTSLPSDRTTSLRCLIRDVADRQDAGDYSENRCLTSIKQQLLMLLFVMET